MLWDRHRHVQACKFAYFLSGLIFAALGDWWYESTRLAAWYWGDTLLAFSAIAFACAFMIAASKHLDEYLEEIQEHPFGGPQNTAGEYGSGGPHGLQNR